MFDEGHIELVKRHFKDDPYRVNNRQSSALAHWISTQSIDTHPERVLKLILSLCPCAHESAFLLASQAALRPEDSARLNRMIFLEAYLEHLRFFRERFLLKDPSDVIFSHCRALLSLPKLDDEVFDKTLASLQSWAQKRLFADFSWDAWLDRYPLLTARFKASLLPSILGEREDLDALALALKDTLDEDDFAANPHFGELARLTGAIARVGTLQNDYSLFEIVQARFRETKLWTEEGFEKRCFFKSLVIDPETHVGFVETARGLLTYAIRRHSLQLTNVVQILSPTHWTFSSRGAVNKWLQTLSGKTSTLNEDELLEYLRFFDPCVVIKGDSDHA